MTEKMTIPRILLVILAGAGLIIILLGLRTAAEIVNGILLAWVIALVCLPVLKWLQGKRVPNGLAILITILLVIFALLALIIFVLVSINRLVATLPSYAGGASQELISIEAWLGEYGIDFSNLGSGEIINTDAIIAFALDILRSIVESLAGAVFMFIIFVFMVIDAGGLNTRLTSRLGAKSQLILRFNDYNRSIRDYVYITAWAGILAGGADAILLALIGVDFPILWGVLAFFMSFIPSVGYIIALIPPTLLALAEFGLTEALIVFFGYWIINGTVDNFLKPRLMGQGLDLSPLIVFLSLVIWGWALGVVGALLAVPITLMIKKVVLDGFEETRWLGYAISAGQSSLPTEGDSESLDSTPEGD